MAWDVLSRDVLSYILFQQVFNLYHFPAEYDLISSLICRRSDST